MAKKKTRAEAEVIRLKDENVKLQQKVFRAENRVVKLEEWVDALIEIAKTLSDV